MKFSSRLDKLAPYPFVEISRIIAAKRAEGADVVTFGIGDPDMPTPAPIIDRLLSASQHPPNHRYPETDTVGHIENYGFARPSAPLRNPARLSCSQVQPVS